MYLSLQGGWRDDYNTHRPYQVGSAHSSPVVASVIVTSSAASSSLVSSSAMARSKCVSSASFSMIWNSRSTPTTPIETFLVLNSTFPETHPRRDLIACRIRSCAENLPNAVPVPFSCSYLSNKRDKYVLADWDRAPKAWALYSRYVPDGEVSYKCGPVRSNPAMSRPTPYGRRTYVWVQLWCLSATDSTNRPTWIGDSYTYLWFKLSVCMYLAKTRASAVRPAIAIPMCWSILKSFGWCEASSEGCLFRPAMTTCVSERRPTHALPCDTAQVAYSTWKSLPRGLKTVTSVS